MGMIQDVKKIYLCDLTLKPITVLNGVQTDTVSLSRHVKDYDVLTFTVDEYIVVDGKQVESNGYDSLDIFMTLYIEDVGMFQMQKPTESGDGQKNYKLVTAYSLEKEFEDNDWQGLKINTGEEDSLEQLVEGNLNDMGFAKEFVTFYNKSKPELSFIHVVLDKMPGWSVEDSDIDRALWSKKIPSMTFDDVNLYNLCVAQIGPRLECLFMFDTINRRIKAIAKTSLNDSEYETGVFIGYRNLANQIDVTVDEDTVFTRFNCRGDGDLGITNVNYQDLRIFDLSYFTRQPYMSDELAAKVNKWVTFREEHREEYIELSKKWAEYNESANELEYRVPSDDLNIDQWDDMNEEGLEESLKYYNTLLTSLQVSVDPSWTGSGNNYDGYEPWKTADGEVDHDRYLDALWNMDNGYGGYYTYYDVLHYIIPNIEIALSNLNLPDDEKTEYIDDWESNWDLYGITELKAKRDDFNNQLEKLKDYSVPWDELYDEDKKKHPNEEAYNKWKEDLINSVDEIENAGNKSDGLYNTWLDAIKDVPEFMEKPVGPGAPPTPPTPPNPDDFKVMEDFVQYVVDGQCYGLAESGLNCYMHVLSDLLGPGMHTTSSNQTFEVIQSSSWDWNTCHVGSSGHTYGGQIDAVRDIIKTTACQDDPSKTIYQKIVDFLWDTHGDYDGSATGGNASQENLDKFFEIIHVDLAAAKDTTAWDEAMDKYNEEYQKYLERLNEYNKEMQEYEDALDYWEKVFLGELEAWNNSVNTSRENYQEAIDNLPPATVPNEKDPKYQWYTNLWFRMGGISENKKEPHQNNYKILEDYYIYNEDWLKFVLEHGIVTMEQVQYQEEGETKAEQMNQYDWVSIQYNNCSDMYEETDELAIAKAQADYEDRTKAIQSKDKEHDSDLKKLDTEHNALQTEYDSLKAVIEKNVERSFKAFS